MYLHYFKSKTNNFGDALNPWFWEDVVGLKFDDNKEEVLVGIGTLLNDQNPFLKPNAAQIVHVVGTGAGYGSSIPQVQNNWRVHCVRGPLTANAIGVDEKLASSDPVIYLNRFIKQSSTKQYKFSFMPHYSTMSNDLRETVESVGIKYISPLLSAEEVIKQVNESENIICEAMHGAILAEALRVPWYPVSTSRDILSLKWRDSCYSLDLEYDPQILPRLWGVQPLNIVQKGKRALKFKAFEYTLSKLMRSKRFILSKQSKLDEMNNKLEGFFSELKK